jgi:aminoglycoside phosphotransferase
MKTIDGISYFAKGEKFVLPAGWPPLPADVISVYGLKLVKFRGRRRWKACTEGDFRESLRRRGIAKSKITAAIGAKQKSELSLCFLHGDHCEGGCLSSHQECVGYLDGDNQVVNCFCQP